MAFGELIGVHMFYISSLVGSGFIICLQRFAGLVAHWPARPFDLCGFAPVMAGATNLHSHAHGQFSRVDYGLPLLEDCGLGEGSMPGSLSMAGLAGNGELANGVFLQVRTRSVTTSALL